MTARPFILGLLAMLMVPAGVQAAELRLNSLFSDHMVLQADMPVAVWGSGTPGEKVKVRINDSAGVETTVEANGKWLLRLPPMVASTEGSTLHVASGDKTLAIQDVLVGEVWIASGQSNMGYALEKADGADKAIAQAHYPWLRTFKVPSNPVAQPVDDVNASWQTCDLESAKRISAVAFFFARELHTKKNVPIGLIQTSLGGTPAEAWTREPVVRGIPQLQPFMANWDAMLKDYDPVTYPERSRQDSELRKILATQPAAAATQPLGPPLPVILPKAIPGWLYNGMVHPLVPYTIRGAIWYQGESNVDQAWLYQFIFPAMITDWRKQWGQGDFPFLFVQIAGRETKPSPAFTGEATAELRESQSKALSLPNTGMAVAIDTTATDWHPSNKLPPGQRLALLARGLVYGDKDVEYLSPALDRFEVQGDSIVLHIKNAPRGLTSNDKPPGSFTIAGKDQAFVVAEAKIEGSTITVRAAGVKEPAAVRYAWARGPECNIYSASSNLPMTPFRTDTWPETTRPKGTP